MRRPPIDVTAVAVALGALGVGIVLILSPMLSTPVVQPILAAILATAGTVALLSSRGGRRTKTTPIGRNPS